MTIWGDYSRIEGKKVFMGVAQIMLDDLDLSNIVIGWYKLFGTSSLVSTLKKVSKIILFIIPSIYLKKR